MRSSVISVQKLRLLYIITTFFLITNNLVSYGQSCLEVPKSILNGTNGFSIAGKGANDDAGFKTKSAGDINNDGIPDIMIGAPNVDFGGIQNVGEIYIVFGKAGLSITTFDLTTLDGTNGFVIRGVVNNEQLGNMISTAGDFNHDGIDDIIVGDNYASQGTAFVFLGSGTGFLPLYNRTDLTSSNSVIITVTLSASTVVNDVSYAGDVNNDGIDDVVINAAVPTQANYFVVFGKSGITDINSSSLNGINGTYIQGFVGNYGSSNMSIARNAGDINDDGIDDLVLGFPYYSETTDNYEGRAVTFFGKNSFATTHSLAMMTVNDGFIITNTGKYTNTGKAVAAAGDFNKDGIDDIIIGAPGKAVNGLDFTGEAYVIFGRSTSFPGTIPVSNLDASTAVVFQGKEKYDKLGEVVNNLKDVNNDGTNDVIITSKDGGKANNGAVYIVFGGATATGTVTEDMIFGNVGYQVFNDVDMTSNVNFGQDVAGIGDFNNDGTNDFIVGSIGNSTAYNFTGASYIFYGEKLNRIDTEAPVISCSTTQELYANATLPNYVSYLTSVTDNCTYNSDLFFTQSPPQGTPFTSDTNVTITVKDKSGNSNSCMFLVKLKTSSIPIDCKTFDYDVNNLNGSNGFTMYGEKAAGNTGYSVDTAGDVNGDGISDFIVSDIGKNTHFLGPYRNYTTTFEGSGYIVYGTNSGFPPNINLGLLNGTNGFIIRNDTDSSYLESGKVVSSAGDINGDGIGDFMISAPLKKWNNSVEGATYIVFGKSSGFPTEFLLSTLNGSNGFVIAGTEYYGASGIGIDNIGDINHDGFGDIAIIGTGNVPKCYIIYGKNTGFPALIKGNELDGTNGFIIEGDVTVHKIGNSVAGLGDVNGDGIPDIAIGGLGTSAKKYVIYGSTTFPGVLKITDINGANGFTVVNSVTPLRYETVAKAGDINGDGLNDMAFGKDLILFGSATLPVSMDLGTLNGVNGFKLLNSSYEDEFTTAGDFNKDGFYDYIFIKDKSAYILYGKNSWTATIDVASFTAKDALKINLKYYQYYTLSYAGDVNKDGVDDVVIGSYNSNTFSANVYDHPGSVFVVFGKQIAPDTEKPVITNCPANKILNIGDAIPDYKTVITVVDNCDNNPIVTQSPVAGTIYTGGSQTVTLTATDAKSNFAICSFGISSVADTEAPIITCPGDQLLACGNLLPNYVNLVIASDNIDLSPAITQSPAAGSPFVAGMTVTMTAKDASNNSKVCSFSVNASADVTKPVITCIGNQTASCGGTIPDYTALITATDNCDASPTITQSPVAGSPFVAGMTVTITAKDVSNNTETCDFLVNASADVDKPVITCIGNQTASCGGTIPDYTTLIIATDNCDASPTITQSPAAGSPFVAGMTVTITAKDASNNTETCNFLVNASADVAKPVIICIGNQTASCGSTIPDYTTLITATDNCDASPTITQSPVAGSPFVAGMTVTITAKDASNNTETCDFLVNASADVDKPVITCIGDQTLSCGAMIPDYTASISATDNCDASPVITQSPIAGSPFVDGITITITARDASNNTEVCSFLINASADVIKPIITCSGNQTLALGDALPDYSSSVIVNDNCDVSPTVTQSPIMGSLFINGMTVVISAKDASGNIDSCSFVVNEIADNELPNIICLSDQNLPCSTTKISDYTKLVTVTDNQDTNPIVTQNPTDGSPFTPGMTVTITATDVSGNEAKCSFKLFEKLVSVNLGDDVYIQKGEEVPLQAITTSTGNFNWNSTTSLNNLSISNPVASPLETTTYTVIFKDSEDCSAEDSITIYVESIQKDDTKYGFSPDNDGRNDFWYIDTIDQFPKNEVSIYNRWGDLVFQIEGYNNTTNVFTGVANRKRNLGADVLPEGTYFFEIKTEAISHLKKYKGFLVLKR